MKSNKLKVQNSVDVADTGPINAEEIRTLSTAQARQQRLNQKQRRKHEMRVEEVKNKPVRIDKLIRSFKYAFKGCSYVFKTQPNMKIHLFMGTVAIIMGFLFQISKPEWLSLILVIGFVILLEFINTAIETLVDLYTEEYEFLAGVSKDVGAATVLVMAIISVIVGLIIFGPKIIALITSFLT